MKNQKKHSINMKYWINDSEQIMGDGMNTKEWLEFLTKERRLK